MPERRWYEIALRFREQHWEVETSSDFQMADLAVSVVFPRRLDSEQLFPQSAFALNLRGSPDSNFRTHQTLFDPPPALAAITPIAVFEH
jgi:hypothetical protein